MTWHIVIAVLTGTGVVVGVLLATVVDVPMVGAVVTAAGFILAAAAGSEGELTRSEERDCD